MMNVSELEPLYYSFEEISKIFKDAGVKPNSYKEVKVIIELVPNGWLYGVTGYSKSSKIIQCLVKGFATESGSQFVEELIGYPLRILVLEKPIPHMELYEKWRQ